jgi:hypothetical protein
MEHFLDTEIRTLAMAEHERIWRFRGDADRPKQSKSKHQTSDYLLTGLLFAKQDGEPLVGVLCGRVGKKVRYYSHRRGRRGYLKGSVFNRLIAAQPLEDAIVDLVARTLTNDDGLRDRIIAMVEEEAHKTVSAEGLAELQQRRDRIKKKTALIVSALDEETLADAREEIDRLKTERRTLDEQIAVAEAATAMKSVDPSKAADAVLAQLRSMAANIGEMPKFAVRQLLVSVIGRVVVDLETKDAEIQLILQIGENFLGSLSNGEPMRLVGTSESSTYYETHRPFQLELGRFECVETRPKGRPCYDCRRRIAA